jgi:hypothetical protein
VTLWPSQFFPRGTTITGLHLTRWSVELRRLDRLRATVVDRFLNCFDGRSVFHGRKQVKNDLFFSVKHGSSVRNRLRRDPRDCGRPGSQTNVQQPADQVEVSAKPMIMEAVRWT